MARVLLVTWNGGGNIPPVTGIAKELARTGHDVAVLGHEPQRAWLDGAGVGFDALRPSPMPAPRSDERAHFVRHLWFAPEVGEDAAAAIDRRRPDVVVVDNMLLGALCAAERAGVPAVVLFHQPYSIYRAGPLADMWRGAAGELAALRQTLGLGPAADGDPVARYAEAALQVVCSAPGFDVPMPYDANAVAVGPVFDRLPGAVAEDAESLLPPGDEPLVLVSLSTTPMDQVGLLQRAVDALAGLEVRGLVTTGPAVDPASLEPPPNVVVRGVVDHEAVLDRVAVVLTHGGHGTTMAALAHGVPLVCLPMGRDQYFNAWRVEEAGAGVQLPEDAPVAAIASALARVTDDGALRSGAARLAAEIRTLGGARVAAARIAELAPRTGRARALHPRRV